MVKEKQVLDMFEKATPYGWVVELVKQLLQQQDENETNKRAMELSRAASERSAAKLTAAHSIICQLLTGTLQVCLGWVQICTDEDSAADSASSLSTFATFALFANGEIWQIADLGLYSGIFHQASLAEAVILKTFPKIEVGEIGNRAPKCLAALIEVADGKSKRSLQTQFRKVSEEA